MKACALMMRVMRDAVLAKLEQDRSFMEMLERLSIRLKTRETEAHKNWTGPPASLYAKLRGFDAARLTLGYMNQHNKTVPDMDGARTSARMTVEFWIKNN
jgi:predicted transcriptional regulator